MSGYMIFVIILTVGYVIYYSVVIGRDLYAKKGQETGGAAEEFAVEITDNEAEGETATAVVESEDGFTVGDQSYEPQQPSPISFNEEESGDSADNSANDKVEELQSRMETTQARGEVELTDQEMEDLLVDMDKSKLFYPPVEFERLIA